MKDDRADKPEIRRLIQADYFAQFMHNAHPHPNLVAHILTLLKKLSPDDSKPNRILDLIFQHPQNIELISQLLQYKRIAGDVFDIIIHDDINAKIEAIKKLASDADFSALLEIISSNPVLLQSLKAVFLEIFSEEAEKDIRDTIEILFTLENLNLISAIIAKNIAQL
jgi:hypothetical protein